MSIIKSRANAVRNIMSYHLVEIDSSLTEGFCVLLLNDHDNVISLLFKKPYWVTERVVLNPNKYINDRTPTSIFE